MENRTQEISPLWFFLELIHIAFDLLRTCVFLAAEIYFLFIFFAAVYSVIFGS